MFRKIIRSLDGIRLEVQSVTKALRLLSEAQQDPPVNEHLAERLAQLEGRLEAVVGTIDAGIIKAESLKGAARASEERARGHMKRAEAANELAQSLEGGEDADPFEQVGRAYESLVSEGDEAPLEQLSPVHNGVDNRRASREFAKDAKRRR